MTHNRTILPRVLLDTRRKHAEDQLLLASGFFDVEWYNAKYTDAASHRLTAVRHYCEIGAAKDYDPGPDFSTFWYRRANPDVAESGINPLLHFVRHGSAEGRLPFPSVRPQTGDITLTLADRLRRSPWFDSAWYLSQYPDVAAASIDPVAHYLERGAYEGRDPGPDFSTSGYLEANPDVGHSELNPLVHYLLYGSEEGRRLRDDYQEWHNRFGRLDHDDRTAIQAHIGRMKWHPTISIIVPIYQTPIRFLTEMIRSVVSQEYGNWQLCLVDDASANPEITDLLRHFAASDQRISTKARAHNGGISDASNDALAMATGDYVALLDHDDVLDDTALYQVGVELNDHPDADIVYTDSDLIGGDGRLSNAYFKSNWNYDLQLGHNLISHLGVYRRSLVVRIGGFRREFDGSQDYDFALRAIENTTPANIRHIPFPLYHWRQTHDGSSFSDQNAERCAKAARRAVQDHFARIHVAARVEQSSKAPRWTRVIYGLPAPAPRVVVFVPDASHPNLLGLLGGYPRAEIVTAPKEGDVAAILGGANADVVIWMASQIVSAGAEWIDELVGRTIQDGVGAVSPELADRTGLITDYGRIIGSSQLRPAYHSTAGYFGALALARRVSAVGAVFAAPRSVLAKLGAGLTLNGGGWTKTFSQRLRDADLRIVWTPFASLVFEEDSPDVGAVPLSSTADPFHNPNLSLLGDPFEIAWEPRRHHPWAAIKREQSIRIGQRQRAARLLSGISKSSNILEIGPSYSPIAPKSEGWRTTIVDHATREELVAKYANEREVWVDRIEQVDFVWTSGLLVDAIPNNLHKAFDAVVASHVVEHSTDLVGFLNASETLLAPGGRVILAVPDCRYTFDYLRPTSTIGAVVEAHERSRARHPTQVILDHHSGTVKANGLGAWGQQDIHDLEFFNTFRDAVKVWSAVHVGEGAPYHDAHAWQFSPSSFALIALELNALGLSDLRVDSITPAIGAEFYVTLVPGGTSFAATLEDTELDYLRMKHHQGMLGELRQALSYFSPRSVR